VGSLLFGLQELLLVIPGTKLSRGARSPLPLAILGIIGVSFALVAAPEAQAHGSGRIYGTVLDSAGIVIPHAAVVVRNEETGEQTTTETSSVGRYSVDNLQPSVYTVEASASGLTASERDNVSLAAGNELNVDLALGSDSATDASPTALDAVPAAPSLSDRISPAVSSMAVSLTPSSTLAQVQPAASHTPPDDTPSIKVGVTLYTDYAYQTNSRITDSDGNSVHRSSFDVTRSYINITGNISHLLSFRITPDASLESGSGSSLTGSIEFRIKYAYLQTNFDEWMTKGSWARFGMHQTPYLDYTEGIYRYRFQGTTFVERNGYFNSSDAGVSFHYNFPKNYGDFHAGIWNGEGYHKAETSNQKAKMFRASFRPFAAGSPALRGLRATFFYDDDHYVTSAERKRLIFQTTFEHKRVVIGYEYLDAHDQISARAPDVQGRGYSIWATPKFPHGWEALLRYDYLTPNIDGAFAPSATAPNSTTPFDSQKKKRFIVGLAYWFPHEGNVSAALLFDYDDQIFDNFSVEPVKVLAVHALINF
jgi:Carboxypeptidase regulatory-like domain